MAHPEDPAIQRLWAPWRLAYLNSDSQDPAARPETLDLLPGADPLLPGADPECFVCQGVISGEDRRRFVLCRTEHCVVLLNRYPYNNGHVLVSPKRHAGRLDELTADEHGELARTVARLVSVLEKVLHPGGFNIGLNLGAAAGAGLPGHLHWHIVPRWHGDTNFMPSIAGVKVIPQSLEALWELLTRELV